MTVSDDHLLARAHRNTQSIFVEAMHERPMSKQSHECTTLQGRQSYPTFTRDKGKWLLQSSLAVSPWNWDSKSDLAGFPGLLPLQTQSHPLDLNPLRTFSGPPVCCSTFHNNISVHYTEFLCCWSLCREKYLQLEKKTKLCLVCRILNPLSPTGWSVNVGSEVMRKDPSYKYDAISVCLLGWTVIPPGEMFNYSFI